MKMSDGGFKSDRRDRWGRVTTVHAENRERQRDRDQTHRNTNWLEFDV